MQADPCPPIRDSPEVADSVKPTKDAEVTAPKQESMITVSDLKNRPALLLISWSPARDGTVKPTTNSSGRRLGWERGSLILISAAERRDEAQAGTRYSMRPGREGQAPFRRQRRGLRAQPGCAWEKAREASEERR